MTTAHNYAMRALHEQLFLQLSRGEYTISANASRLRISTGTYYIPDLCVLPREFERRKLLEMPGRLEVYEEPLPLVVEVWSPSAGDYDVEEKLREYQRRGDVEIWRIHPYEHTLTVWRLQTDGNYSETLSRAGQVQLAALPNASIDLDALFPS